MHAARLSHAILVILIAALPVHIAWHAAQSRSVPAVTPQLDAAPDRQDAQNRRIGTMVLGSDLHSDNCVFFVRDRVRSLPYGLSTWKAKRAIINAHLPRRGDVAVIAIPSGVYRDTGHVALVEDVGENSLTILEANYYTGRVSRRTAVGTDVADAASALHIAGYYRP